MADGSLTGSCLLHSGAVSEARPARGPRSHPPEWKGMGPRRCHCRTSYPPPHVTATRRPQPPARLLLLLLLVLLYSFACASGTYLKTPPLHHPPPPPPPPFPLSNASRSPLAQPQTLRSSLADGSDRERERERESTCGCWQRWGHPPR